MATATNTEPARPAILDTDSHGDGRAGSQTPFRIPWPETKDAQRRWQLEQMAGAFRIFSKLGFADGSSGHISLRGRCIFRSHADSPYPFISNIPQIQSSPTPSGSTHMACTSGFCGSQTWCTWTKMDAGSMAQTCPSTLQASSSMPPSIARGETSTRLATSTVHMVEHGATSAAESTC